MSSMSLTYSAFCTALGPCTSVPAIGGMSWGAGEGAGGEVLGEGCWGRGAGGGVLGRGDGEEC